MKLPFKQHLLALALLTSLLGADDPWKGYLQFGNLAEPTCLDPHIATGVPEGHIMDALLEGLTTLHTSTMAPEPGMAESWTISPDGKTYVFKIRKATWSNGDAFTAQDFVDSWQRMMRLTPASEYVSMMEVLEGATDYIARKHEDFSKVGVKAPDAFTLVVTLRSPTPYFLELLAHSSFNPVHHAKGAFSPDPERLKPGKYVGNGPFTLVEHTVNSKVVVKKNPAYWDAARVRLPGIVFHCVDKLDTCHLMFRDGTLDVVDDVPPGAIAALTAAKDPTLRIAPWLGTYFFRFNVTKAPFSDKRVRRAFCKALNKKRITKVTAAGEIPWNALVPSGMDKVVPYVAPKGLEYDPEGAKALLAEAGYPGGKGFPEIELLFIDDKSHEGIALETAQQLEMTLGIKLRLTNREWKVYLDDVSKLNFQMAHSAWIGDFADPSTFLDMFSTGNGNNHTGWSHKGFDELISKSASCTQAKERYEMLARAEAILVEDELPIIPVYTFVSKRLVARKVQGLGDNLRAVIRWKDLSLTP